MLPRPRRLGLLASPAARLNVHATGQQLPAAEYDHNDRANCSGWNICHADHSTPNNYELAAILPGGRVHDADQQLAHQF